MFFSLRSRRSRKTEEFELEPDNPEHKNMLEFANLVSKKLNEVCPKQPKGFVAEIKRGPDGRIDEIIVSPIETKGVSN